MTIDEERKATIRRLFNVEHYSIHAIVKSQGVHHLTVKKILKNESGKPTWKVRQKGSLIEPYRETIEEHLAIYPKLSCTRLIQILVDRGYKGSISTLRVYVRNLRPKHLRPFMKMVVRAGEQGQVDWAHVGTLKVGNAERKLYLFVMVLSYSRAVFAKFCVNQETSTFFRCHEEAFHYFGGCPRVILYDNLKSVVLSRRGAQIRFNKDALDFAGYYCFEPRPCNIRSGNEKGRVERTIRYLRDNYLPARPLTDLQSMNESLRRWCDTIGNKRPWPDNRSIRVNEIWQGERSKLLSLPAKRQHPVQQVFTRSIKRLWINFDLNTYSIPLAQLGRPLLAEADDSYVSIFDAGKLVVRHPRSYGRGEFVEAKEHRSELIEKRQFGRTNFFRDQITRDFPDIERLLEHMFNLGHDAGTTIKRIYKLRGSYGDELFAAGLKLLVTNPTPSLSAFHVLLMQLESKNKRIPDVKLVLPNNPKVQDLTVKSHSLADYDELF